MAPRRPAQASKAKPTGNRSSRAGKEKQSQPKPREEPTKAKYNYRERRKQHFRDYARLSNGLEVELPEKSDFFGRSRVPNERYYSKIYKERKKLNKNGKRELKGPFKAREPHVPDPEDDNRPDQPYCKRRGDQEQEDDQEEERAQEPFRPRKRPRKAPLPEHIIRKTPPTFMGIPREIRMQIYRHLLILKKPIAVHGGWKQVYWTKSLHLSTSILRASKIVHEEASVVLYGANTFLYRLRDAIFNGLYIDNLATDDSWPRYEESDSGSEYEEELEQDDEDDEDDFSGGDKESRINIEKYAHLFRHIIIEAEANRYSMMTQDSMVAAMNVFRKPVEGGIAKASCNIHTLTVRIMPIWDRQQNQSVQGRFTFVDFFLPGSPVIQAIKSVDSQMLHVDILTRHTCRRCAPVTLKGSGSCRLTINRRHEQAMNYFKNQALAETGDKALRRRTVEMAKKSVEAIDTLAKHIEKQCNQRHFDEDTTMDMDVDSPDWLYTDQDDDDDAI